MNECRHVFCVFTDLSSLFDMPLHFALIFPSSPFLLSVSLSLTYFSHSLICLLRSLIMIVNPMLAFLIFLLLICLFAVVLAGTVSSSPFLVVLSCSLLHLYLLLSLETFFFLLLRHPHAYSSANSSYFHNLRALSVLRRERYFHARTSGRVRFWEHLSAHIPGLCFCH